MSLLNRLKWSFRRRKLEGELDDEMRFHLEMRVQQMIDSGMDPEQARAAAARRFGNRTRLAERCRERDTIAWIESALQDVRFGLRMLRRTPGVTAVAVLSLALGIGANTAIFSIMDAVMIRELPVRRPQQLFALQWHAPEFPEAFLKSIDGRSWPHKGFASSSFSYAFYEQLRKNAPGAAEYFAFIGRDDVNLLANGQASIARMQAVSGSFFSAIGVPAALGRTLIDSDDREAAEPAVVLSHACWEGRFGADPAIAGKRISINRVPFTIAGVAPREFYGMSTGRAPDLWIPLHALTAVWPERPEARAKRFHSPEYWWLLIAARLPSSDAAVGVASAVNAAFAAQLTAGRTLPPKQVVPAAELVPAATGIDDVRSKIATPLFILMSLAALVLLIASANVASLLLARASARQRETAVRLALGAGRARLIRQHLTESLLLAGAGGILSLLIAHGAASWLVSAAATRGVPFELEPALNLRVLGFAAGVAILTGIAFGLIPAFRSSRVDLSPALKESRRSLAGSGKLPLGKALVVVQVALSLVLVIGASLFVRTLVNLRSVEIGFNPRGLLLFTLDPTTNGVRGDRLVAFYRTLLERIQALPVIESAGGSKNPLLADNATVDNIRDGNGNPLQLYVNRVSPAFFATMKIPIRMGREFTWGDGPNAARVAVINETLARRLFKDRAPLGRQLRWWGDPADLQVVGIARDAKYSSVQEEVPPTLYVPFMQSPSSLGPLSFAVRTAGNPAALVPSVRAAVRALAPDLPVAEVRSQLEQIDESLLKERVFAALSTTFGSLALLLAAIGLYGVLSYAVAQRTKEIGIRIALGARRGAVVAMILRETALLLAPGAAAGLGLALAGTRLIASELYGLQANDTATLAAATVILALVALAAGLIPARRAATLDPLAALREE